jgi:alpha/beta superfamily hydrolase
MILRRSLAALSVVLVTTGFAPPSTRLQAKAAQPLRHAIRVDSPLNTSVSYLQSGDAKGVRVIFVHGTLDDLVPFANVAYMQTQLTSVQTLKTVVLAGQNHFLPWNSEAQVREAVLWAVSSKVLSA